NACGRLFSRSSTRLTPWALMSAEVTEVTGATLVRFGVGIRVPVTTISETSADAAAGVPAAQAAAPGHAAAPAQRKVVVSRRLRTMLIGSCPSWNGRARAPPPSGGRAQPRPVATEVS